MKKKQSAFHSLKFDKIIIAKLDLLQGGKPNDSEKSSCCSEDPVCPKTVTTRPDSVAVGA